MNKRERLLAVFSIILLVVIMTSFSQNTTHAQQDTSQQDQSQGGQIPSDLSLDLQLAQQDPAPDQQQIVQAETDKAQVVTTAGTVAPVVPHDIVAPEVKIEPAQAAVHPEETTSEQVITIPVTVQVTQAPDQNQQSPDNNNGSNDNLSPADNTNSPGNNNAAPNISPAQNQAGDTTTIVPVQNNVSAVPVQTEGGNIIPGTTIVSPDDNAAPLDGSTNPNLSAPTSVYDQNNQQTTSSTDHSGNQQPTSQPADISQPVEPSGDNSQQNIQPAAQPEATDTSQSQPSLDNSQQNALPESQTQSLPVVNNNVTQTQQEPTGNSQPDITSSPANNTSGSTEVNPTITMPDNQPTLSSQTVQGASTVKESFMIRFFNKVLSIFGLRG